MRIRLFWTAMCGALAACSDGLVTPPQLEPDAFGAHAAAEADAFTVTDLEIVDATRENFVVEWTVVDDGTGAPAWYRVKVAEPPIRYSQARFGCNRTETFGVTFVIGQKIRCTITNLRPNTVYGVQLMSYRLENGVWTNARRSNVATGRTDDFTEVTDLDDGRVTRTDVILGWTQVKDIAGDPARYRVKYGPPGISWKNATTGCNVVGTEVGAGILCTITGLTPSTDYQVQLMSYRLENGVWVGARYSNIHLFRTLD